MGGENYNDLQAFLAVAREGSFTRAAAQLGLSQSALSHKIQGLEARLGLRLLTRTTRSVSPTEAGSRLQEALVPNFENIDAALAGLSELRDKPSGNIRITSSEHAAATILWPALEKFLPQYPDIRVEVVSDSTLTDIVAERFDAGIRLGEQVAQDMIAVPIGPPTRLVVAGAPEYLAASPPIATPRDLTAHDCINLRFLTHGGLYAWEFEKDGHALNVRVQGRLIFNSLQRILEAALAGFGLAYLPEDMVLPHIRGGRLRQVLDDWCPLFAGYHLYYPSRRQPSPAFALLVDALRYRKRR
ncbi:LysR family transcriptional regulator [Fulvimonas soli]|jgi:DNA-binding transcriptional LysR family regulator|uniref:DNA-binding transcriptional LysR family regulator n=1 Tax=Fulvimonas soli TaxID=155197 RepID=A0A316IHC3_9GAMM|nr:LysR family transcriptional regulator [Fulvimonas soli]PWK92912.1 DNA-binding transcriptional LysR family regulator [Fulvimonas soli]TNY26627.1 LysR family transcriptional regulator [Fulvimonas soli]